MLVRDTSQNKERNEIGRLINFRPVFTFALFLIFGILVSYTRIVEEGNSAWLVVVVFGLAILSFVKAKRKFRCAVYIAVFIFAFFIWNVSFVFTVDNYRSQPKLNGVYTVVGTVVDKSVGDYGGEISLTDLTVDGVSQVGKMSVSLTENDFSAVEYCDRVTMRLTVSASNLLEGAYGFRAEAIADERLYYGRNVEWYNVDGVDFRLGVYIRGRVQETLRSSLSDESAALVSAVLLGDTSLMEDGLMENIRYGGIAHIFAVSGLHIGVVFAACVLLFRRERIPAPVRFALTVAVLLFYGAVCGYSASVVRATVTCLVFYLCTLVGLKSDSLENLSLAAVIVLMLYPTLLFGVGAQLSFCACLGILLLAPPMRKGANKLFDVLNDGLRYKVLRKPRPAPPDMFRANTLPPTLARQAVGKVISFLSVSFSAQIATAPILYLSFGYLSALSLLLNCIFVPIVAFCFAPLLALTAVAVFLPQAVGAVVLYPVGVVASSMLLPFYLIRFSGTVIHSPALGAPALVAYYAAVVFASDKFNLPKFQRRLTVIGFFIAFLLCLSVAS